MDAVNHLKSKTKQQHSNGKTQDNGQIRSFEAKADKTFHKKKDHVVRYVERNDSSDDGSSDTNHMFSSFAKNASKKIKQMKGHQKS